MSQVATTQLSFDFDPSLQERFATKREYIAYLVLTHESPLKRIAADVDLAPSTLSRKLNPGDGDCQRFTIDDEEKLFAAYPDIAKKAVAYDISKWFDSPESRKQRIMDDATKLMQQLQNALSKMQGATL